jgi:hypothetical protein
MSERCESNDGAPLLRRLDAVVHELSQPVTVLLCTLEYGADLNSAAEMEAIMRAALLECERLRRTMIALQDLVRLAEGSEKGSVGRGFVGEAGG